MLARQIASMAKRHLHKLYWLLPLLLHSMEANAWGLVTHLYFAHSLLWAMPLLDPRLQRAIKRFPELVMAGACLPDLAIVSPAFRETHDWEYAKRMLNAAKTDEETAIAVGYASHLYVDVIAHNHFVPAHEAMWLDNDTMMTHIASEWAMDAHLSPLLDTSPSHLLTTHRELLVVFISPLFRCSRHRTTQAVRSLAFWDKILRMVRLPHIIYRSARLLDKRVGKNFIYYIAKTQTALAEIGIVLDGARPSWEPESQLTGEALVQWRRVCKRQVTTLHPAPIRYFDQIL
jgi:hypothetical protein